MNWLRVFRVAYLVVLTAAATFLVTSRWNEIVELVANSRPWYLILSLLLSFGLVVLNSQFWTTALDALGSPVSTGTMLEASARSLLARWIPGGIWYAAGRATLLSLRRVSIPALTTVAALELTIPLLVGMVMGTLLLAVNRRLPGGIWWLAPVGAFLAALALRPVVNRVLRWLAHRRGVEPMNLPQRAYLALVGWTAVYWLWAGATFVAYLAAFPTLEPGPPLVVAGAYMVAWGIGFVVPIAPQGIGIFEVTLAALLGVADLGAGSIIVAGYRLVTLVRDLIATGIGEIVASTARARHKVEPEGPI
jgi:glycosyltransferase 2 family protein